MATFPKYHELICNTYTPDFAAGSTPCTLQSAALVTKSRLVAGGTFFRSAKNGGSGNVNNIILECIVIPEGGGIDAVTFNVTGPDGSIQTFDFIQEFSGGSPHCVLPSGPDRLRTLLTGNDVVTMPLLDDVQPWNAGINDSSCLLSAFGPTTMGGAAVLPVATSAIRTGPTYTLFHIVQAETGDRGEITNIDTLSEWTGVEWVAYPSPLYDPNTPPVCP